MAATITMFVDPAAYVGNVYGTAPPNAQVIVWDGARAIRTATADADGTYLINNIPTPDDGRDYTIACNGVRLDAHVLPGATMALEANFSSHEVHWKYRHEGGGQARSPVADANFTKSIFATREGLVGGTTANGHVIATNDHFVALPSRRALSANGGHEREVRLTYRGATVTAPVWDIGPWNTKDDYWNPAVIRESFKDLPRGMPESEAAYTSGYNGGLDERGRRVLNPAGIDLADGTFLLDLGLTGNDRVSVEYLWLDQDGPIASSVTVSPTGTVEALITDSSPIAAAEAFVDVPGENGTGISLTANDGAFDSATETVHGGVGALRAGLHVVYVNALDVYGNWGPLSAKSVAVGVPLPRRRGVRH